MGKKQNGKYVFFLINDLAYEKGELLE
jgi:hypothetical protein